MAVSLDQDEIQNIDAHPPKGRFALNLVANVANFLVSAIIGVWYTPYLIHHLSVEVYGMVPLAVSVTNYLGLFTLALNGAVGRFLTIALEKRDYTEANRIFNTSLVGSAVIVLILLGPTFWLSTHASWFFKVPAGYEQHFSWLFLCTIGLFLLTTMSSAFSLSSFSRNRFDLSNAVNIVTNIVRVAVVVLLFRMLAPASVWHVGVGMVVSGIVGIIGAMMIWRYLTPMLHIIPKMFNKVTLVQLTSTGGWLVITQIGTLLFLSIDLIVVNRLLGDKAVGNYGAVMYWSSLLRSIAGVVAGVFAPTVIALYARNDLVGMVRYSRKAVKFLGLVMALPIGIICGLSGPLLRVWLGPGFEWLAMLMSLMTIHLCVNLGILPLFNIQVATNNVRIPGIVTLVTGALNLGLAILLAGPVGWGMYGVAAAGAIMLTTKNLIFTPLYGAHILGIGYGSFFRETIPIICATLGIAGMGWLISSHIYIRNWPMLIGVGLAIACIYLVFSYTILLTKDEREMALRMVAPRRIR